MDSTSDSTIDQLSQLRPQVFINFRGADLRDGFISHLVRALRENNIKYYIDEEEHRSEPLEILFQRIRESQIALVFFSEQYATSEWCLDELVEIMKNMEKGSLRVIPIFFKVTAEDVKGQKKEFGVMLYGEGRRKRPRMPQWEDALEIVPTRMGMTLPTGSSHDNFLLDLVKKVKEVIDIILSERRGDSSNMLSTDVSMVTSSGESSSVTMEHLSTSPHTMNRLKRLDESLRQRLKQLEERFDFRPAVTKIVGIVGMSGIGKTTLAEMHFREWGSQFVLKKMILGIHERSKTEELSWLARELLDGKSSETADMFRKKFFFVLDDVSEKKQIEFIFSNLERIKKGSKIVITTRDKSWIEGLVDATYAVPGLNDREALQLFSDYAFNHQDYNHTENSLKLSKKFVGYAGGNPQHLEELGKELCRIGKTHWETELAELPNCCNEKIRIGFRTSYDELTDQQKDVFLDIACFFRSENEDYVRTLLASNVSSDEAAREVRDLADKFMISISAGQIEMPDLLCSLGKELGLLASAENNLGKSRLWDHDKVKGALVNSEKEGAECVRGISLDVSKLTKGIAIDRENLTNMSNLRYFKIYDSRCPRQCEVDCKVNLPEKLDFPLKEIRYFHWLKFPLKRLPSDFNPENLIDLRLPYSKIKSIWKGVKDTSNLKWVDLSYSTELTDLSALSKAESLQRLSLEGCIMLGKLPEEMENMKSLSFLNLRGCTSLSSLPENMNLISLKTLILSDCSNFIDFQVISNNLEHLHLDRTAIEVLPLTIHHLERLIVLNLKDCEMLESLPICLDKLKALEELILSGCSRLQSFPEIREKMENLQIILLDGTLIKELPKILLHSDDNSTDQENIQRSPRTSGLPMLRRLCLRRNNMICSLDSSISQLYHLKWMDLKYCENLLSISTLPPNIQCLDAHACISLKTLASPLALMPTKHVPSTFIFTNCDKLEHLAKNEITCYGHCKGKLLSETLNRHNKGLAFKALVSTCFPGSEVPAWFCHKASGAVLEPELPRHWSESGFVGIALCAIVSFEEHTIQSNNLQMKCICSFNKIKTSFSYFSFPVEGLSKTDGKKRTIKSTHVFIGYTNWLNIKKCQEDDGEKKCVNPTTASIKFEVADDTGEVMNCEVVKCGFSLVYESGSWEANSGTNNVEQGEVS